MFPLGKGYAGIYGETEFLTPYEHMTFEDILLNEFGVEEDIGGILITTDDEGSNKLGVWMRTYNDTPEGTYGQNIPPKGWKKEMLRGPPAEVSGLYPLWDEVGVIVGVNHDEKNRANLILQNSRTDRANTFRDLDVAVKIIDSEGKTLGDGLGFKYYHLIPGEYKQINNFVEDILGKGATLTNGVVKVWIPIELPGNRWDNSTDPYNYTKGGVDARVSVVNGNVYQGTNDARLITFYKMDMLEDMSGDEDPFDCKGDFLCEKALEYVVSWLDIDCRPVNPEGMQYDTPPVGDGKCAKSHEFLSNKEVRSMINGCDPQGSTGYVCGLETGRSVPSYAKRMAKILARDPRWTYGVDELEQWLYAAVDENPNNGELYHSWDPMAWVSYDAQLDEAFKVAFYFEPDGRYIYFELPTLQDTLEFYDLIKESLIKTVSANPEWYNGDASSGPDMHYDPTWYEQNPNE